MIKHRYPSLLLAAAAAILIPASAFAAPAHANQAKGTAKSKSMDKAADAAKPSDEIVEYKDLEHRIGADLAIETTFNTVRRGTLVRYTNPGLTIQLGPEAGAIELEVPVETIRRIRIVASTPQAAKPPQEETSAKKN